MKSYAIADVTRFPGEPFFERVAALSDAGVDYVQLRAKHLSGRELWDLAVRCRQLVSGVTRLIVNGRADVALASGADGVHLPASGLPCSAIRNLELRINRPSAASPLIVGRSCHSVSAVHAATAEGCQYALLGPVFATRSKTSEPTLTLQDVTDAAATSIEVFALGGVSRDNLRAVAETGVAGVAAITLFMVDEPLAEIVEDVRAN